MSDSLLDRARAGDAVAWGELLEQHRGYLLVLARMHLPAKLQGKVDAADLVQEASFLAFDKQHQLKGATRGELLGWLREILANCLAMAVRRYLGTQARDVRLERRLLEHIEESSRRIDRALIADDSSPSRHAVRHETALIVP